MKKKLLVLISILVLSSTINFAYSRTTNSTELSEAIRLYKSANYTACYAKLNNVIKKDSTNALAYYYLGMTATHLGKKDEAIDNYGKAISLTSPSSNLNAYAEKGKRCLEAPDKCNEPTFESSLDEFINKSRRASFSDQVKSDYERLKIENMKREMNRSEDFDTNKLKDFKDFSSMNNEAPTNDEIVAALRVLQKAGIGNLGLGSYNSDMSYFTGNTQQAQLLNMLGGSSSISPQLIQTMLTNNMSLGF